MGYGIRCPVSGTRVFNGPRRGPITIALGSLPPTNPSTARRKQLRCQEKVFMVIINTE